MSTTHAAILRMFHRRWSVDDIVYHVNCERKRRKSKRVIVSVVGRGYVEEAIRKAWKARKRPWAK